MKNALVNNQLTPASSDAPPSAVCPYCGNIVELRNRSGTFFWRHRQLPIGGCPSNQPLQSSVTQENDAIVTSSPHPPKRQVDSFIIELHTEGSDGNGHHLKLCRLSAEANGEPTGIVIYVSEVRPLTRALLDALADLVDLAAGDEPD
jgi:hypothetical protein